MAIKRNRFPVRSSAFSPKPPGGKGPNFADLRGILADGGGQHCPPHYPPQPGSIPGQPSAIEGMADRSRSALHMKLGPPLSITEVALLIGCSPWTVRQRLMPLGLPYFRSGASSKLIFYTDQVVRWIESKQKGG